MRAVGYARVSTEEQATHGCSLAAQEEKIRAYAALYGIELVEVIQDCGISAKTLKREGLQQALKLIDDKCVEGIVIAKLDRLTRSVKDWASLIESYFNGKASLMSVNDQIDTRSASGRVVLNVLVAISAWEREIIGERTAVALKHKQSQGIHVGSVPFGSQIRLGRLIEDDTETRIITFAISLREKKMGYESIADELTRMNFPTKRGGQWRPATVRKILLRHKKEALNVTTN